MTRLNRGDRLQLRGSMRGMNQPGPACTWNHLPRFITLTATDRHKPIPLAG